MHQLLRRPTFLGLAGALLAAHSLFPGRTATPAPFSPGTNAQAPSQTLEEAYRANNLGVARLEQYDHAAAAAAFRQALQVSNELAIARLNLALALYYASELDQAKREAEAARERLQATPHADYVLGLIAREADRPDEALAHFERVRKADPLDVGTAINIGQIHLQEGRYADARSAFAVATKAEPYNVTAVYGLALALIRDGAREEGAAAMQRFQELRNSGYATTHSRNYLEQGRYAEAIVSTGVEPELVDTTTPDVQFRAAPLRETDEQGDRGVTLLDYDGDGDLDLLIADSRGVRLQRNDAGTFGDVTDSSGLGQAAARLAAGADYDNDGLMDLALAADQGVALFRQSPAGRFIKVPAAGLEYPHAAGAIAWFDADHDGDVDLYVGGGTGEAAALLYQNNGNGTFSDITGPSRLGITGSVEALVATDFDNRRDIDLLVGHAERGPLLFRNLRDGTFGETAAGVGLDVPASNGVIAAGDTNKDTFTDFYLGARTGGTLALSDGRGGYVRAAENLVPGARAAQFLDYDNDGLLDLVALTEAGLRIVRNLGARWVDVTRSTFSAQDGNAGAGARSLSTGDVDGDGDLDLVTGGDRVIVWRNDGGSRRASVRTQLSARVSNRSAIGSKVEIRAGSLRQKLEVYASSPAPAPADLVFGLGDRPRVDVVRVLWPAGILQAEVGLEPSAGRRSATMVIEELDRKPSSCPYLYTWNGERFEFLTDFLGGGEMGYWLAPGLRNTPDPDEYIRIDGTRLVPRNGRYELRITNELEEALFLDRAQLVLIDHPASLEVHPAEGLTATPRPFELYYAGEGARPLRAVDDHGHDVLDRIAAMDRRYPDDFPRHRIRGYAEPHTLTLTLPAGEERLLLLTGWTDYAFSGDNVAAHQAGLSLVPPSLEVRGTDGVWRKTIDNIGFPVGRPQTVVVDLAAVPAAVQDVRIATSMRIYWDQVRVARRERPGGSSVRRLEPLSAALRWRGFSAEVSGDGREPYAYDYSRVSAVSPWKVLPGRYTREGDVRELLGRTDDMFVIARSGDEIALAFDAMDVPALRRGWRRTFLLYADGFSKEMDLNSSSPDQLAPLPFHGMRGYPYGAGEAYPATEAHRRYQERYNTRVVPRAIPPIELSIGSR